MNAASENETINVNYNIMVRKYSWVYKALGEINMRFLGLPFMKFNYIY